MSGTILLHMHFGDLDNFEKLVSSFNKKNGI